MRSDPSHGGYPGEPIAHDLYLRCADCGWSYPFDQGDDECYECGGELLETRMHPAPESTLRLDVLAAPAHGDTLTPETLEIAALRYQAEHGREE